MKILKHILNFVVWTTLGLYLTVTFVLQLDGVQEWMGHKAANVLSEKLGTSVSIGHAKYDLLNHLTVYQVGIKDQAGHDMLWVNRLSARVNLLPLINGKISIASAQLFGMQAKLYQQDADSKPNFQFVLDSLASKDTTSTSSLDLRINSLIIRNSRIMYDRLDMPETPQQLNANHVNVNNISAHVVLKVLNKDSLNVNVKRLSFKERSGLRVDRLAFHYEGGRSSSTLHHLELRMPGTLLKTGEVRATYYCRDDHFVTPSLQYTGSIQPSTVTLADLSSLLPELKSFNEPLSLSTHFSGQGESLTVHQLNVTDNKELVLEMDGECKDISNKPVWRANIHELAVTANAVSDVARKLSDQKVEVPAILTRLGSIQFKGDMRGTALDEWQASHQLQTDAGRLTLEMAMDLQRHLQGNIGAEEIDLQRLTEDSHFGKMDATIDLTGTLPHGGQPSLEATANIKNIDFNGYSYKDIAANGTYSSQEVTGNIYIDDPNLGMKIEGSLQKDNKVNNISLTANIMTLIPQALHLSDQWEDTNFIGDIHATFKGTSLNDVVGNINLSNFSMLSSKGSYELDQMNVHTGYNEEGIHYIAMNSDFGELLLTGDFDYATMTNSFTNIIADKLPTLPGLPATTANTNNNFSVSANIKKSDWLQRLLNVPLTLHQPLTLQASVNDATRQMAVNATLPQFSYNGNRYGNGYIDITSPNDSLLYDVSVVKMADEEDEDDMTLRISGNANDNLLAAFLEWDNHAEERMSGQVNATANFDTTADGLQTAYISISPSQLNVHNKLWNVEPSYIVYSKNHLDITQFAVRHEDQHLTINGTASEYAQDTLNIDMQDIDVEYVLGLVDFDAVDFNGFISGKGTLRGLFGDLEADARLTVNQFEFQHGRMGTLQASVDWNKQLQQIDINAIADDGPDAKTYINGYVTPKRDSINLKIRAEGTYLDFAQSFTSSFISRIDGHATGSVNLIGPLSAINLTGEIVLNGQAHVKPLGCTYEMRNDTLRCVPNEMAFVSCPIYDKYGRQAIMTGGIHHEDLTNMTYDIYVSADNLLSYEFHDFGDDTFYGTVFATGEVAIHGRENELRIEGDLTPQRNTIFVYNAANPDAIANQEFIVWGKKEAANPADSVQVGINRPAATRPAALPADYRSDLHIALRINATTDATVRLLMDARTNDYINLHGTGVLNTAYYNKGGFQMFGTYRVSDGTYDVTIQDIIKKNFIFNDGGTVVFSGDPYEAALNLQAQYTVNGVSLSDLNVGRSFSNTVRVKCLMNIEGQPKEPVVDFDLDLPNVNSDEKQMVRSILNSQEEMNQQVLYLLAVGRFYPQQANNAAEDNNERSKTTLAMQSLLSGTLSGQINSMLNSVINSNNWNFGANISTGDEGWNNAEYEGLISGRMLNNRLLINGQFGYRDNATTATPSFIGDFDIQYLLLPNGNLALKVYNQTNDRYFTRSSLNTQGVGIIMKKDFSGIHDLLGIKKKKKNAKKVKKP